MILATQRIGRNVAADCAWLLRFEGDPPSLEQLRSHVGERVGLLPWLRGRLVFPRFRLGAPAVVADPDFELARHVQEVPRSYTEEPGWLRFIGEELCPAQPDARPVWTLHLAHGEGCFALILRHHHFLADGQSGFRILRTLLAGPVAPSVPAKPLTPSAPAVTRKEAAVLARAFASWARGPRPARVINRPLSVVRRAGFLALAGSDVNAIAEAAGCFPNEVFLALLAGGLRRYLGQRGVNLQTHGTLQAGVMVDLGGKRDPGRLGNHYAAGRISLELAEPNARSRLRAIRAALRALHEGPDVEGSHLMVRLMTRMPTPAVWGAAWLLISPRTTLDTIASHLAGARGLTFGGARPTRICSWTYLPPGHSLSFVCQLTPQEVTVNVLADPYAIPDLDRLLSALREARDELLETFLARGARAPSECGAQPASSHQGATQPTPSLERAGATRE